jgi:uncharacterized RDD family membrane protein YckC
MDYHDIVAYDPLLARRSWAAFLDYLFCFGLVCVYIYLAGERKEAGLYEVKGFSHLFTILLIWIIYFPGVEGIFGYTCFKGLFDLKIVPENRRDSLFVVSFKRHILDPIDFAFFGTVAVILVKVRSDHKRLGDMFAHSKVLLDKEVTHDSQLSKHGEVQTAYNTQNNVVSREAK